MAPAPGVGAQVTRNPAGSVVRGGSFFVLRPKSLQNSQPRAACSSNAEYAYVRVQNEDGLAMEAPITLRVRIRVDTLAKKATWMEDAGDARGVEDRSIRTYSGLSFSCCEVFDEMNWSCRSRGPSDGQVLEKPEIKDGQLSRFYWTDTQHFERRQRSTSQ